MSLADLFATVAVAKHRVLLLDDDGTLAPFRIDPRDALPYPGVREALDLIVEGARAHIVTVSSRWTKDLVPLLGFLADWPRAGEARP